MKWRRKADEHELDRELSSHLELEAEERRDAGMNPDAARFAAKRTLGNQTLLKEAVREIWGADTWGRFRQDLRHASRMLRKNPGFALAAVTTLALGIGANTAMFGVVHAILLRPLPFPEPDRLISVTDTLRMQAALVVLRDGSRTTDYAAYSGNTEFNLTGQGEPARLAGSTVSANLFTVFGQGPLLGRTFQNGEDSPGRDRVVILSHALWQSRFRGDPNIVGRSITIDDIHREVAGVMPPGFRFPSAQTDIWLPLHVDRINNDGNYFWVYNLNIVGRLRPGFSREPAQAELRTFVPQIRDSFPWKMWPDFGSKSRIISLQEALTGDVRTRLLVLLAAVGLVLLIACVNVANLLLASGTSRQKEISVRTALGASRSRVVRQLLTESLLLAFAGAAAGLLLAVALGGLFRRVLPANLPQLASGGLELPVLGFTAALALATGLGFGVFPAIRFSRVDVQGSLKSEDRTTAGGRHRLTNALVSVEIALGVVVVIGAGLLARSFWGLINVNPGFRTANSLSALLTPNPSSCRPAARCLAYYQAVLDRARALPGVEAVAAVNPLPLSGDFGGAAVELEGHPLLPGHVASSLLATTVTPEYFATTGIPILAGRGFLATDRAGAEEVALVTASTAQRWWPGENPVGKHLKFTWLKPWKTVVGVVADTREAALSGEPDWVEGHFYLPHAQNVTTPRMSVVLRTSGNPLALEQPLRQAISGIRNDVPVTQLRTMDEVISDSLTTPRSTMWLLFSFAALALLLSAVGIYAVVAYTVAQRTREIGIRMALGARAEDILRGILGRSLVVTAAGLAMGLCGAWAATRVLRSFLFQITTTDTVTFVSMPLMLTAVALLATYVPARRAARVDPAIALRYE